MAITYFGSSSTPTDNSNQAGPDVSVTPPASMVAGDLVVLVAQVKSGSISVISVSTTGGQTWTDEYETTDGNTIVHYFWCTYNGTWSADPNVNWGASPGTDPMSVVMHVFRPTSAALTWFLDTPLELGTTFVAPTAGSPDTIVAGRSPTHDSTVTLVTWATPDDNNWSLLSGTGWVQTGTEEYRNIEGTDQCLTFAHFIATASGPTGDVQKTQTALNRDAGISISITWHEANTEINLRGGTLLGGTIGI